MRRIFKILVKSASVATGIGLVVLALRSTIAELSDVGDTSTQTEDNEQPKPERLYLIWHCTVCDESYRIKTKKRFEAWLRAGNVVVFDCRCGTRFIASETEVDNFDWFLLQGFFRHLLDRQDIIEELGE